MEGNKVGGEGGYNEVGTLRGHGIMAVYSIKKKCFLIFSWIHCSLVPSSTYHQK